MFIISRLFSRLTLRCLCSVFIGVMVVALCSRLLSSYGGMQDSMGLSGPQAVFYPDHRETTLQKLAAQLARESERLSHIAPAAGR